MRYHVNETQQDELESRPCKYHAQRFFGIGGEHVVGGLAIGGVGDMGD
jgi:hypothetical protein